MDKDFDGYKQIAYDNVITTEDTTKILGRTRQQINNLINSGDIAPFKKINNANLFWKPDVYELLRKINRDAPKEKHIIYGSSTERAKEAFRNLHIPKDEVEEVYVFFSDRDAIQKNFYNLAEEEIPDTLVRVEAARFIIIMNDGKEYWFQGLTCGYDGTGTAGTEYVLEELGIDTQMRESKPHPRISYHKICHYFRENGEWKFEGEESESDESLDELHRLNEKDLLGVESYLYRYNGHLVLTQGARYRQPMIGEEVREPSKEMLAKSLYFVPNPVSVQFLTKEEALSTGHYEMAFSETLIYQIIIKDWSDRELWINYPLDDIPQKKQQSMRDLMEMIGVRLEDDNKLSERIVGWLGKKSRNYYGTHIVE